MVAQNAELVRPMGVDPECPVCHGDGYERTPAGDAEMPCGRCYAEWTVSVTLRRSFDLKLFAYSKDEAESEAWIALGGEWADDVDDFEPDTQDVDVVVRRTHSDGDVSA